MKIIKSGDILLPYANYDPVTAIVRDIGSTLWNFVEVESSAFSIFVAISDEEYITEKQLYPQFRKKIIVLNGKAEVLELILRMS